MDIDKMFAEPTDEQVAKFLKEWDEGGKDRLSQEAKDALSSVGFRRSLQFSQEIRKLTAQLEEARMALDAVQTIAPRIIRCIPEYRYEMGLVSKAITAITQSQSDESLNT